MELHRSQSNEGYEEVVYFCGNGSGNSFVVFDFSKNGMRYEEVSEWIHLALHDEGVDSALVIEPHRSSEEKLSVKMRVIEQDGSESAFCGNGARLIASYLIPRFPYHALSIATPTRECPLTHAGTYAVVIGAPEHPFDIHYQGLEFAFVSVCEEPHILCADFFDDKTLVEAGQYWNRSGHPLSGGVNVSCMKFVNGDLYLKTYERGVNQITPACGSASVAAVFVTRGDGPRGIVKVRCAGGTNWVDTTTYALGGPTQITSWKRLLIGGVSC